MSLEEYLQANIKSDILEQTIRYQKSSKYKQIQAFVSSDKYKDAKKQLKKRDEVVHENILADIQRLQDSLFVR
jgi:CHASE3 domain sensor protein